MQGRVAPFAATPDSTYGQHAPPPAHEIIVVAAADAEPVEEGEARLLIEEDPGNGLIVYRRIDRRSGQVVAEFSRDAVLKMGEDTRYVAGEVIRTKA